MAFEHMGFEDGWRVKDGWTVKDGWMVPCSGLVADAWRIPFDPRVELPCAWESLVTHAGGIGANYH